MLKTIDRAIPLLILFYTYIYSSPMYYMLSFYTKPKILQDISQVQATMPIVD